nr:hypothetical protein [uncultured Bacteroides sp.]
MKAIKVLVFSLLALPYSAFAQNFQINISDAKFTRPLIEKWVTEYKKVVPSFSAEIVNSPNNANSPVLQIEASGELSKNNSENVVKVGRYVLLPIANVKNPVLSNKKFKRGFNEKQLKELFVQKNLFEENEEEDSDKKLKYTVYSRTGHSAETTNLFAHFLNVNPNMFKGKRILGEDTHVLAAVLKDVEAVSFNTPGLIYDINKRLPLDGLAVLPVDLNNDGKVEDSERKTLANLDALTSFLENSKNSLLPTNDVNIIYHRQNSSLELNNFISWIESEGQKFVNEYGFLSGQSNLTAEKN